MTTSTGPNATVQVVTDSTADLPAEVAAALGISVVPAYVHFGDEQLRSGIDISNDEFYRRLSDSKELPRTSQPAPADFVPFYREALERGPVLSLHVSAKLSGTFNAALLARQEVLEENPDAQIAVVDTEQASMTLGLLASRAIEHARAGESLEEIAGWVEATVPRTRTLFVVDTLEYLARGGRLGRGQAFLGGLLNVKPILEIRGGEIHPRERARSRRKALDRLAQLVAEEGPADASAVAGSTDLDSAHALAGQVRERFGLQDVPVFRIGPVVGVYAGHGCIGVGVIKAETAPEP